MSLVLQAMMSKITCVRPTVSIASVFEGMGWIQALFQL